jgi:hypothetical protein
VKLKAILPAIVIVTFVFGCAPLMALFFPIIKIPNMQFIVNFLVYAYLFLGVAAYNELGDISAKVDRLRFRV